MLIAIRSEIQNSLAWWYVLQATFARPKDFRHIYIPSLKYLRSWTAVGIFATPQW